MLVKIKKKKTELKLNKLGHIQAGIYVGMKMKKMNI